MIVLIYKKRISAAALKSSLKKCYPICIHFHFRNATYTIIHRFGTELLRPSHPFLVTNTFKLFVRDGVKKSVGRPWSWTTLVYTNKRTFSCEFDQFSVAFRRQIRGAKNHIAHRSSAAENSFHSAIFSSFAVTTHAVHKHNANPRLNSHFDIVIMCESDNGWQMPCTKSECVETYCGNCKIRIYCFFFFRKFNKGLENGRHRAAVSLLINIAACEPANQAKIRHAFQNNFKYKNKKHSKQENYGIYIVKCNFTVRWPNEFLIVCCVDLCFVGHEKDTYMKIAP